MQAFAKATAYVTHPTGGCKAPPLRKVGFRLTYSATNALMFCRAASVGPCSARLVAAYYPFMSVGGL